MEQGRRLLPSAPGGPQGRAQDGTVAARPVELGPLTGNLRVVRSGLRPQDRVIISGLQRARPGQKVQPQQGRIQAATGPEPAAAPTASAPSAVATPVAAGNR